MTDLDRWPGSSCPSILLTFGLGLEGNNWEGPRSLGAPIFTSQSARRQPRDRLSHQGQNLTIPSSDRWLILTSPPFVYSRFEDGSFFSASHEPPNFQLSLTQEQSLAAHGSGGLEPRDPTSHAATVGAVRARVAEKSVYGAAGGRRTTSSWLFSKSVAVLCQQHRPRFLVEETSSFADQRIHPSALPVARICVENIFACF